MWTDSVRVVVSSFRCVICAEYSNRDCNLSHFSVCKGHFCSFLGLSHLMFISFFRGRLLVAMKLPKGATYTRTLHCWCRDICKWCLQLLQRLLLLPNQSCSCSFSALQGAGCATGAEIGRKAFNTGWRARGAFLGLVFSPLAVTLSCFTIFYRGIRFVYFPLISRYVHSYSQPSCSNGSPCVVVHTPAWRLQERQKSRVNSGFTQFAWRCCARLTPGVYEQTWRDEADWRTYCMSVKFTKPSTCHRMR